DEAIARVQALRTRELGFLAEAWERTVLARLASMKGEFDEARELVSGARQAYTDAGLLASGAAIALSEASIERRAGDHAAAERALREGLAVLEEMDERAYRPTLAVILASVLYEEGRYDEAATLCEQARPTSRAEDLVQLLQIQ